MIDSKHIAPQHLHIWHADLDISQDQREQMITLLSEDERQRAERYHFPIHSRRFIAARAYLREILAWYLNMPAKLVTFSYSEHNKPFLAMPNTSLQFNLSHSENKVIFAFSHNTAVGIDIEKIQTSFSDGIAKRFFSPIENEQLSSSPDRTRNEIFYRVWARKEAIVKAMGKGLSHPLSSFSVPINNQSALIPLEGQPPLLLIPLNLYSGFEAAVCSQGHVNNLSIYTINDHDYRLETRYDL